jgi:tetratricopeptide (TPR) repeat protein
MPAVAPDMPAEFWSHPSMATGRASRDMGTVSHAYRHHPAHATPDGRPLPQEWIASWVGTSQVQVCRIERGTCRVRDLDKLVGWARALRMPSAFAWFEVPYTSAVSDNRETAGSVEGEAPSGKEDHDVRRRTLLTTPLAAGVAAVSGTTNEPWTRMKRALHDPRQLTEPDVDQLERDTADYFRREELEPARRLAPGLREHTEQLSRVLAGSPPEHLRKRLLSTTGEALALYGWFAFDRGDHRAARRFYDLATAAARDAGDSALTACVLAYCGYLAEATGNLRHACDHLAAAQQYCLSPSSAATRSWLAARQAEVLAALGEQTDALRALERATTAYDYARPHHERVWTAFFTGSRLGSMAVTTYIRLNHPRMADTADAVIDSLRPSETKIKAIILADLATAAYHRATYEQVAAFATDALTVTTAQEVSIGADRLRNIQRLIRPHQNVAVLADLDKRIANELGTLRLDGMSSPVDRAGASLAT